MKNKKLIGLIRDKVKNNTESSGEFVEPWNGKNGYMYVTLYDKSEKPHDERLDKLVASSFVPNPDPVNFTEIRHKDGNKRNNKAYNLEWCAPSN